MSNCGCDGPQVAGQRGCTLGRCIRRLLTPDQSPSTTRYVNPDTGMSHVYYSDLWYPDRGEDSADPPRWKRRLRARHRLASLRTTRRHRGQGRRKRNDVYFVLPSDCDEDEDEVPDPWGTSVDAHNASDDKPQRYEWTRPSSNHSPPVLNRPTVYDGTPYAMRQQLHSPSTRPYYTAAAMTPSPPINPNPRTTEYQQAAACAPPIGLGIFPGAPTFGRRRSRRDAATEYAGTLPTPASSQPTTPDDVVAHRNARASSAYSEVLEDDVRILTESLDIIRPYVPEWSLRSAHGLFMYDLADMMTALLTSPQPILAMIMEVLPDLADRLQALAMVGCQCVRNAYGEISPSFFELYIEELRLHPYADIIRHQSGAFISTGHLRGTALRLRDSIRPHLDGLDQLIDLLLGWVYLPASSDGIRRGPSAQVDS